MEQILEVISRYKFDGRILWSVVAVITIIVLSKITNKILYKSIKDHRKYYTTKKRIGYIMWVIILFVILNIWAGSSTNLTTYIGLLSAGIAISLKEVFANLAAWVFISIKRPFDVGHRVLIGGQRGDVIDIRMFQFSLIELSTPEDGEQSTGRIIDIPNHFVFVHPLINYTKGFEYIWNEVKVLITFESDWQLAKTKLTTIVNKDADKLTKGAKEEIAKASKKYMIYYDILTPIVYMDVKDSGVQLTLRYLCTPKQRRNSINQLWIDILHMIDDEDKINLAYPTKRVVD